MRETPPHKPSQPRKNKAARRLLSAVDRMIVAARQADEARRELAQTTKGATR
jgi:hypothetical protein